jgi:hypothetical protein
MRRRCFGAAGIVAITGLAACTSGSQKAAPAGSRDGAADAAPSPDAGTHADARSRGDTGAPEHDGGAPGSCTDDAGGAPDLVCVTDVHGRVVDGSGAAAASGLVSACGPSQCNPGTTGADGRFRIDVGFHLELAAYSVQVHARPDFTAFYFPLPVVPGPRVDMGDLPLLPMPASGPALDVSRAGAPAQSVTSGDVTIQVAAGIFVRLDPESNLAGDHGKQFRALTIPPSQIGEYAPPSLHVAALYAFEPFEASFEFPGTPPTPTGVRFSFANAAGFPAGAAVDVLALGSYVYPDWIPPARFTRVAGAHVSSDGKSVEMDAGGSVKYLTWIGLAPAP